MKYDRVVYNLEFSSLKNTSLSVINAKTTYNMAFNVRLTHKKNKANLY